MAFHVWCMWRVSFSMYYMIQRSLILQCLGLSYQEVGDYPHVILLLRFLFCWSVLYLIHDVLATMAVCMLHMLKLVVRMPQNISLAQSSLAIQGLIHLHWCLVGFTYYVKNIIYIVLGLSFNLYIAFRHLVILTLFLSILVSGFFLLKKKSYSVLIFAV